MDTFLSPVHTHCTQDDVFTQSHTETLWTNSFEILQQWTFLTPYRKPALINQTCRHHLSLPFLACMCRAGLFFFFKQSSMSCNLISPPFLKAAVLSNFICVLCKASGQSSTLLKTCCDQSLCARNPHQSDLFFPLLDYKQKTVCLVPA